MKLSTVQRQRDSKQTVVILSAELAGRKAKDNAIATECLERYLNDNGIKYKQATGFYKGTKEVSFVCYPDMPIKLVHQGIVKFKQECVLVRDGGGVKLVYHDEIQVIGSRLTEVSAEAASKHDSYTMVDGKCWVVA